MDSGVYKGQFKVQGRSGKKSNAIRFIGKKDTILTSGIDRGQALHMIDCDFWILSGTFIRDIIRI